MTLGIEGIHQQKVSHTDETIIGGYAQPAIEFRDVELAFDDHVILDNISFTVRRGETKIVLGGSGTGKSTTAKTLPTLTIRR